MEANPQLFISCRNKKYLNLGQKCFIFGFEFEKAIAIIEINTLEFV